MGILARSLGIQALSLEDPSQPLLPMSALTESLGWGRSDAGVLMNETQAMRITTAQSCVRIISEDLATNSHQIFQRMPDGSMRMADDHRYWGLIYSNPNPNMGASVFWGALTACAVTWGNGYAWIKRDRGARVVGLYLLKPGLTAPMKRNGEFMYGTTQTDTGQVAYIDPMNMLHVRGLSLDGVVGLSPIRTCMNAFGLTYAAEKFGAQFFGNGARASGVFTYPGVLEPEAHENLKKSTREMATGENALRPLILEEGMEWHQTTINPNEAQFLATRQFQRSEIASLYRVAMHLLQDLQRATNNNIEHQSLDHIRYCLLPWAVRTEEEVNWKIFGNGPFQMEHNFKDKQRGDFASQAAGIQILRNIGYYSNNDIARELRENPMPASEGGDIRIVQGAMIPLTALLNSQNEVAGTTSTEAGLTNPFDRIIPAYRNLFRDAIGRTINRTGDAEFTRKAFQPLVASLAQALIALRFGGSTLNKGDIALVDAHVNRIAAGSGEWTTTTDASRLATTLTEQVYGSLASQILN